MFLKLGGLNTAVHSTGSNPKWVSDSIFGTLRKLYGSLFQNKEQFVFTNERGEHLVTYSVWRQFKQIVTKMNLPEIRFHDLRHTYATLALQNGVDVKTVSYNLGHATVAFTMDKYMHVTMNMQKESVKKMESFIASL